MKIFASTVIVLSSLLLSCQSGKEGSSSAVVLEPDSKPVEVAGESGRNEGQAALAFERWPGDDSLIISLRRTPCFGKCPVYQIQVYSDGSLRYDGVQFTERLGTYFGKLAPERYQAVFDLAEKIGFQQLAEEYPSGDIRIMDLPSAIVYLRSDSWEKQVVNRNHANPEVEGEREIVDKLNELQSAIDALLTDLPLILVGEGKQH